jgi:hypothetical protein
MTAFTGMKFDQAAIAALVDTKRTALKANKGVSDLLAYGLGVVARRLAKSPQRYRDYGPYWWALKAAANANGYSFGDDSDSVVAAQYCGKNDLETMVMADQFRTEWLEVSQVGTVNFPLSAEGDDYLLYDADMEARVPGR